MKNTIIFDGVDILDYHAYIFAQNAYNAPARLYDTQAVPGRNGALLIDLGRYENIPMTYAAIMMKGFKDDADDLRNVLLSRKGYKRLEDTFHPDEYYMAVFRSAIEATTTPRYESGKIMLEFERKPQRFLKSGETGRTFAESGVIVNPELLPSLPLIRIYGNGTATVNGYAVTVSDNASNYTDIDCDIQEAFRGDANRNGYITLDSADFPRLDPGENTITLGTGITKIDLVT